MTDLPLAKAADEYDKAAGDLAGLVLSDTYDDVQGASGTTLHDIITGLNEFLERTSEVLTEQAATAREQHEADAYLAANSLPVQEIEALRQEAERAEHKAKEMTQKAVVGKTTGEVARRFREHADAAAERYAEEVARRSSALTHHTTVATSTAPRLLMEAPTPYMGGPVGGPLMERGSGGRSYGQQGAAQGGGHSAAAGAPGGTPGAGDLGGASSTSGGRVSDDAVSTETSGDGMGGAATLPQQPMLPQYQPPVQPTAQGSAPYGMTGGVPGGMLSRDPALANTTKGSRNRKRDKDYRTELTGAGAMGGAMAATFGPGGAVDRGVSVSGVNTKADTTGSGSTQLSGANGQRPGDGGGRGPGGGLMRGGMMPMGALGSGAQGGSTAKPRGGDGDGIKPVIPDRELTGADSIRGGVEAGIVGRETAKEPDELGFDRFLDPERLKDEFEKKRRNREEWS